jgi:3-hydroxyisobutyrate dehydrogenase
MRIAVLGTGTIGAAVAGNLVKAGHDVVVWNRTRAKAEAVQGATVADTPADAVHGAEAVLTTLTDGDAVEATVRGIDALPLWIQSSTVGIDATDKLIELARQRGATYVDAPVVGTKEPAERGELVVLAAGPREIRPQADEIFDAIGSRTVWLDEPGQASRLKLVVNAWLLALVHGLAESLALAGALGLDPQLLLDTIEGGPTDAPFAQLKGKAMLAEEFPPSFPLKHALKDAHLVLAAAREAGLTLPGADAVAGRLERAAELGHGDEDLAAVYEAVRPA